MEYLFFVMCNNNFDENLLFPLISEDYFIKGGEAVMIEGGEKTKTNETDRIWWWNIRQEFRKLGANNRASNTTIFHEMKNPNSLKGSVHVSPEDIQQDIYHIA